LGFGHPDRCGAVCSPGQKPILPSLLARRGINRCRGFARVVVAVVGIRNWVEMKVMVIMVVARPLLLAWSVLILKIEDIEDLERLICMQVKTVLKQNLQESHLSLLQEMKDGIPFEFLIMLLFC
jgi:hypothetical protein